MARLTRAYDRWWESLKPTFSQYVRIGLGSDADNPTRLMSHDWLVDSTEHSPWHQVHVTRGMIANGPWAVQVVQDGRYYIDLYRWPRHLNKAMERKHAKVKIGDIELEKDLPLEAVRARFELDLKAGPAMLKTWLTNEQDQQHGAYIVWVERFA